MLKLNNKYKYYKNLKPRFYMPIIILCFSLLLFFGLGKIIGKYNSHKQSPSKESLLMTENLSVLHLYKNGFHPKDDNVDFKYINSAKDRGLLYNTEGRIRKNQSISGSDDYYKLDCSFVKENLMSDLGGEFFVSKDAKILYIDSNKHINTNKKSLYQTINF